MRIGILKPSMIILFAFASLIIFSQDAGVFRPDSVKKELIAVRINGSIKVDGELNEEEWKSAKPSSQFIQVEPKQGASPNFQTIVMVLYNRQYLYFGFICYDSLGKKAIRATDFRRDFGIRSHDHVAIAFDG